MSKTDPIVYSRFQLVFLVLLRFAIGWYFLYEGVAKLLSHGWSSYAYLIDSQGIFEDLFKLLTQNPTVMLLIDYINIFGLILIGLLIILGLFEKISYIGALLLLIMYYLSHPALIDTNYMLPAEGSYLWINKNVVMIFSLLVLYVFPTAKRVGIERIFCKN